MATTTDEYWYPTNMDKKATWHANWNSELPAFAAKYNISAAILTQAAADNTWIQHWVQMRHKAENLKTQLTQYFATISVGAETAEPPAPIDFKLDDAPAEVPPGIKARTQEIAAHIKGSMNYAVADGELLGIVSTKSQGGSLSDLVAAFILRTLANFELEATFKKQGMDAMQFEYRFKNGVWQIVKVLTSSPGIIKITPETPGVAQQVEMRAIHLLKNQPVGNYSLIATALIAP